MDPIEDLVTAVVARLLADAGVLAIVAQTDDGPAIFAPGQPFANAYPRIIVRWPQLLPVDNSCVQIDEIYLELDCYARGSEDQADGDLVAGRLANAAREAMRVPLSLTAHGVMTQKFLGVKVVGDPATLIGHTVPGWRLKLQPTA